MATIKLSKVHSDLEKTLSVISTVNLHEGRLFIGEGLASRREVSADYITVQVILAMKRGQPSPLSIYLTAKPKPKELTRAESWRLSAEASYASVQDLIALQQKYKDWGDSLGAMVTGEMKTKMESLLSLELQGVSRILLEAKDASLPQGFGRD